MTSPSLKRNFLENSILDDFQLSFPAENALKNYHFQNLKFEKNAKFDFSKQMFRMILMMFECKPYRFPSSETRLHASCGVFLASNAKISFFA